jgi:Cu/Ag efflux pump CusA
MFETSVQAQFLIPMAITIVFGLALATFLVLLVVPSLVAIGADIRHGASGGMRLAKQLRRSAQAQELPVDYEERPAE